MARQPISRTNLARAARRLAVRGVRVLRLRCPCVWDCDISWSPSILRPVFYGYQDFGTGDGAPTNVRVFYPSLDGAVHEAPFLAGCGRYPLVLFLHGDCGEADHYKKWYHPPAQLARSGYVVAVPQWGGNAPWNEDLGWVQDLLTWMRGTWPHHEHLMPSATGVVGHSYGGLLAGKIAAALPVSAFASFSAPWLEWPSSPPSPLTSLGVPALLTWGTSSSDLGETFAALEGGATSLWNGIDLPKHKVAFTGAYHWDYLPAGGTTCESGRGPCALVDNLAADYLASFLSKYMPPELAALSPGIPDNLIPPTVTLTTEQQFFAGAHLTGFAQVSGAGNCTVTHSWVTASGASGTDTL